VHVSEGSRIQALLSYIPLPLCFVRFDSSTLIFAEALPLLNTPKFGGGLIFARLDKIIHQLQVEASAYRESTLSDAGGRKPMHQCEASRKFLPFLVIRATLCVIFVFFLVPCARLDFSWIHNLPLRALAFPSLCKPCYAVSISFGAPLRTDERKKTCLPNAPHQYRFAHGTPCE
jgi:hypothetical protein